ncbi:MAG: hypothetical protein DRJ51_06125 [Thermoprotei archaeon]|nr:MAG: hypothetical protein DRJ51_06125 [Thermoprotei archaeon]
MGKGSKLNVKLIAFTAIMGALGNILGLFSIVIPSPLLHLELHLSQLTPLLVGIAIGPKYGAITGALSLIVVTIKIKNPLIPLGNAILAGVAGLAARKFRPVIAGLIGEIAETPFIWFSVILWAGIIGGLPIDVLTPIITLICIKAFFEVLVSSVIVELLLKIPEIRRALDSLKTLD